MPLPEPQGPLVCRLRPPVLLASGLSPRPQLDLQPIHALCPAAGAPLHPRFLAPLPLISLYIPIYPISLAPAHPTPHTLAMRDNLGQPCRRHSAYPVDQHMPSLLLKDVGASSKCSVLTHHTLSTVTRPKQPCNHGMKHSPVDAGLSLYSVDAAAVDLSRTKGKGKASKAARAGMLFTHRGFSGPAVLDLSHHAVMALDRSKPKPGALFLNPKP